MTLVENIILSGELREKQNNEARNQGPASQETVLRLLLGVLIEGFKLNRSEGGPKAFPRRTCFVALTTWIDSISCFMAIPHVIEG